MIKNRIRRKQKECPNCGTHLSAEVNFCPNCGQENHHHRVTIGALLRDLVRENFTLDTKSIRSIVPLVIKPGFLTLEFINGKRANYNRPLRLYLFVSFIYFLLSGYLESQTESRIEFDNNGNSDTDLNISVSNTPDSLNQMINYPDTANFQSNEFLATNFPEAAAFLGTREGKLAFREDMISSLPVFIFALIPVLGFWMFLLFYKRGSYYVDSFVFVLHGQSAVFIGLIIVNLIMLLVPLEIFQILLLLLIFIYFAIAAKRVYHLSLLGSILRLLVVGILHGVAAVFALVLYLFYLLATFV